MRAATHYHRSTEGLDCANILLCGTLIGCFAASPRNFVFGCIAAVTAVVVISCLASLAVSVTGKTLLSLFLVGVVAACIFSICKNNGLCPDERENQHHNRIS